MIQMSITSIAGRLSKSIQEAQRLSGEQSLDGVITSGALLQDIYLYLHGNKKDWFYFDGVPFEVIQDKGIGWGIRIS